MISSANQLTGFYIRATLAWYRLIFTETLSMKAATSCVIVYWISQIWLAFDSISIELGLRQFLLLLPVKDFVITQGWKRYWSCSFLILTWIFLAKFQGILTFKLLSKPTWWMDCFTYSGWINYIIWLVEGESLCYFHLEEGVQTLYERITTSWRSSEKLPYWHHYDVSISFTPSSNTFFRFFPQVFSLEDTK